MGEGRSSDRRSFLASISAGGPAAAVIGAGAARAVGNAATAVACTFGWKPLPGWGDPGAGGGACREHVIDTRSPVEFAFLVDILNTGKPRQLLPQFGDEKTPLTWYELGRGSGEPWVKHEIS